MPTVTTDARSEHERACARAEIERECLMMQQRTWLYNRMLRRAAWHRHQRDCGTCAPLEVAEAVNGRCHAARVTANRLDLAEWQLEQLGQLVTAWRLPDPPPPPAPSTLF